mgnify:CR=1 FL=1
MIQRTLEQLSPRLIILLINQVSTIVTIPWLANHLSVDTFGLISTSLILIQTGWIFIEWGGMNYTSEVNISGQSYKRKNLFVTNFIASKLILAFIYLLIIYTLVLCKYIYLPWEFFNTIIPATIFGGIFPLWFYHVIKRSGDMVLITFFTRIVFLTCVIWTVHKDSDALLYLQLFSITVFIITVYAFIIMALRYHIRWEGFSLKSALRHISTSKNFFINSLSNNYIHSLWSISLTVVGTPSAIGFYNISEQAYRAGKALSTAISQVIRVNSLEMSNKKTWRIVLFFAAIYTLLAVCFFLISEPLIKYFFSMKFYSVIPVVKIMIFIWLFNAIINLINYPILVKLVGVSRVHKLNPIFLITHGSFLSIWIFTSETLINMMIFLCLSFLTQFLIMTVYIKKNNH